MKKGVFVAIVLVSFLLSPLISHARTFTWFNKDWDISGYIRQEAGWNLSGKSDQSMDRWRLRQAYYTLYLDTNLRWNQVLNFRMINRVLGDLAYNINHHSSHWKERGFNKSDDLHVDNNFRDIVREVYANYSTFHWNIRIGKQQVAWGQSDGVRLCDIINPLDISRQGIMRDSDEGYEETRIPLWMLKLDYSSRMTIGPFENPGFEFLYTYDIQHPRLYPPDKYLEEGGYSPWSVRRATSPFPDPDYPALTPPGGIESDTPSKKPDHSEFGIRFLTDIGSSTLTLNFWRGYYMGYLGVVPPIKLKMKAKGPTGIMDYTHLVSNLGFTLTRECYGVRDFFKRIFNWYVPNPVLRIESLYSWNVPYERRWKRLKKDLPTPIGKIPAGKYLPEKVYNLFTGNGFKGKDFKKVDVFKYMIGLDWPVRISFINPRRNIFISGQFFHFHIFDWEPFQAGPYPKWEIKRNTYMATLLLSTSYLNEKLRPQILMVKEFTNNTWWMKPKIGFWLGNHWRPEIGAIIIEGDKADRFANFGQWRDRDELYIKIKYQF